jgi:hypothetical protein
MDFLKVFQALPLVAGFSKRRPDVTGESKTQPSDGCLPWWMHREWMSLANGEANPIQARPKSAQVFLEGTGF